MAVKKRNKVSAEFSMSSLTDIIFLLLIFFMLTSSMIQINVKLPESDSKTVAPTDYIVMMTKDGKVTYNGKTARLRDVEALIKKGVRGATNKENATVTIIAEIGVPWQKVNEAMTIASRLKMRAIIATQPKGN
ncbi:MAG: biopolymer transporter ExbD [Saprospiraceae bacterium]